MPRDIKKTFQHPTPRKNRAPRPLLVSAIEHKCVLSAARAAQDELGFKLELLPVDTEWKVRLDHLNSLMGDDVLLIAIMAVNNEIGTIQDVINISEISRKYGSIFLCDAAQAGSSTDLGKLVIYADLISLSSHKIYGPAGIGALFVSRELQGSMEPLIYGGGQQKNLRSGTVPVALAVGMGAAAEIVTSDEGEMNESAYARYETNSSAA